MKFPCEIYKPSSRGYTGTPEVTLQGGGATTAAVVNASAVHLNSGNTSGGLTKLGLGTLTLAVAPTYTGNTEIADGTLQLNVPGTVTLSTVTGAGTLKVADGTTLIATSIDVGTLTIGGPATGAALAAVPEPGTLVLLALAGLTLTGAYLRRK